MSEHEGEPGGFSVAVVTSYMPVEVSIQHLVLDISPDDFFTVENLPKGRDYPFDTRDVDDAIEDAGYVATTGLQWTGTHWALVVVPQDEEPPLPTGMLP